jgi:hypothetical protein
MGEMKRAIAREEQERRDRDRFASILASEGTSSPRSGWHFAHFARSSQLKFMALSRVQRCWHPR